MTQIPVHRDLRHVLIKSHRRGTKNLFEARAEWHELERVRQWKSLPLYNPVHPQAFQSRDEYGLGTLEYQDRPQPSSTTRIELCPSVAQGLDRAYILQQLSNKFGVESSRDVAASLQCELIESVPDGIQAITKRDRTQI